MMAYDIAERQISGGPNWLDSDGYDIYAKAAHPSSREQIYLMLETLLTNRFKLGLHRETRECLSTAMAVEKGGPKLKLHENADSIQPLIKAGAGGGMVFQNVPLSRLAANSRKSAPSKNYRQWRHFWALASVSTVSEGCKKKIGIYQQLSGQLRHTIRFGLDIAIC